MTDKELEASQALSQEIDRGFPAIPQSQLDDLIPLEGLDGDDEDKIMALYRTIQGPPKETAFTDEQLERYLAEVRREGYEAGVNDERLTHVPGWEDWMQGHAKGYKEGAKAERERIVKLIQGLLLEAECDAIEKPEYYDDVYTYRNLIGIIAAEQGQDEGDK